MEVNARKELHIHSIPLVMLILALTLISAACYESYRYAGFTAEIGLARALVTPVVQVKPASNGLAQINLRDDQTEDVSNVPLNPASSAGQGAAFSFSLQSKQ